MKADCTHVCYLQACEDLITTCEYSEVAKASCDGCPLLVCRLHPTAVEPLRHPLVEFPDCVCTVGGGKHNYIF